MKTHALLVKIAVALACASPGLMAATPTSLQERPG